MIKADTLILTSDRDVGTVEHAFELSKMIPTSRLIVLPYSHGDYMGESSPPQQKPSVPFATLGLIEDFLQSSIQ